MRHLILFVFCLFIAAGCVTSQPVPVFETAHRYFKEVDRPGSIYSVLKNPQTGGAFIRVQEINEAGLAVGDTLSAWVQHFNGRKKINESARRADLVIACNRDLQPEFAQAKHVLPESHGEIYVYQMRGGLIIISDDKISFYEVMLASGEVQR